MKEYLIKDLMVPLSEYATVRQGATLLEAVLALEKAQAEYDHTKYRHRAVLVLNQQNKVIGKISQLDVLCALEPQAKDLKDIKSLSHYGFSNKYVRELRAQRQRQHGSVDEFCAGAVQIKVEDIMQKPDEGEIIGVNETLEHAIHQLAQGRLLSLLVTEEDGIVGLLRMSDVFAAIFHAMKKCEIT